MTNTPYRNYIIKRIINLSIILLIFVVSAGVGTFMVFRSLQKKHKEIESIKAETSNISQKILEVKQQKQFIDEVEQKWSEIPSYLKNSEILEPIPIRTNLIKNFQYFYCTAKKGSDPVTVKKIEQNSDGFIGYDIYIHFDTFLEKNILNYIGNIPFLIGCRIKNYQLKITREASYPLAKNVPTDINKGNFPALLGVDLNFSCWYIK